MSNRDLFKEAIADAKTIKETAIANAKVALEETFAPQLRSMLSAKLEEMEKEDMEEGYDEKMDEAQIEEAKEEEVTEAKEEIDEAKDMDEELDLDEILAELEEGEDKEDVKEVEEMDETIDEAEEDEVEVDAEEEIEGEDEDEEIDLEEMSEDDLKSFIEDVIADMVKTGELEAGEEFEAEDEEDSEEELEIEADEEVELTMEGEKEEVDEIVNEEKEDMDEGMMDKLKAIYNDPEVLGKLITVDGKKMSLKDFLAMAGGATAGSMVGGGQASTVKTPGSGVAEAEVEDMMEEVNELRAELHEVNLLNAKLLYSNKIFRAQNLKESQKVKVLEAFDKASNVQEVKLIFETLSEEVKETKTVVRENLGRASKAVGVIAENKAPIVDVNPQVARWQRLAGIK